MTRQTDLPRQRQVGTASTGALNLPVHTFPVEQTTRPDDSHSSIGLGAHDISTVSFVFQYFAYLNNQSGRPNNSRDEMMRRNASIDARAIPPARRDKMARDNHDWIVRLRASRPSRYNRPYEK
ncbi:hypothetical protein [Burkholderia sp. BCC0397]|uniref:hypothetical protein n=1 Tax=Burkholderia sp. BCC0397 TaxID=486876 RepID=UPI00158F5AA6|nr:hypothetical protein [Burkholderia sp. BCC0397]